MNAVTKLAVVVALLLCTALLGGCEDTTFEAQPSREMASCDPGFVGHWHLVDSDHRKENDADDEMFVIAEPGCARWRFIEKGEDDEKTNKNTHLSFGKVARQRILAVKLDDDTPAADTQGSRWKNGYLYFRYEFRGDSIELYPVDDVAVARLILDEKIQGRTEKVSAEPGAKRRTHGSELHNFVAGTPDDMARAVQMRGIFQNKKHFVLKPATEAEIFRKPPPSGTP
jgi:hypothetical protein